MLFINQKLILQGILGTQLHTIKGGWLKVVLFLI